MRRAHKADVMVLYLYRYEAYKSLFIWGIHVTLLDVEPCGNLGVFRENLWSIEEDYNPDNDSVYGVYSDLKVVYY